MSELILNDRDVNEIYTRMCGQKQLSTIIGPGMDILSRDKIISNIIDWLIDLDPWSW